MNQDFVHLHVHSDYSIMDSACTIYGIADAVIRHGMSAVAITDHGSMGGALESYRIFKREGIKPIIGCEIYFSPEPFTQAASTPMESGYHLVLLAKTFDGYQNLCRMLSRAMTGRDGSPQVSSRLLSEFSEGLIGLSACMEGEIAAKIMRRDMNRARMSIQKYIDMLGRENFYIELMDHGLPEQRKVNRELILLARKFSVKLVATNDVHYLRREDAGIHDLLLCIRTNSTIARPGRYRFPSDQFYFKSRDEMFSLFAEVPEACRNTLAVAERCTVEIPLVTSDKFVNHYPVFRLASDRTQRELLNEICLKGVKERYGFEADHNAGCLKAGEKSILARMDYEIDIIDGAGFTNYFLIIWDLLKYSREQGIAVGPGRGSVPSSLVAYLMRITDIDPVRHSLVFERFLNPEHINIPDIDIDFSEGARRPIMRYLSDKYGRKNLAKIGTYARFSGRFLLKKLAKVAGMKRAEAQKLLEVVGKCASKYEFHMPGLGYLAKNCEELQELMGKSSRIKKIIDASVSLEGIICRCCIHSCAVAIGDQPIENLVPIGRAVGNKAATMYHAASCENIGLLKQDILELRQLSIFKDAVARIDRTGKITFDIGSIPLDDRPTLELFSRGDTDGIFQFESQGMRELARKTKVGSFEDIIALIALCRPDMISLVPEYIERKNGRKRADYDHPLLEPVLKETYGILLYQEQVIQAVHALSGFTLCEADILRMAIGKRKMVEVEEQKRKFIDGCRKNGVCENACMNFWDRIMKHAAYAFNKSHVACYALIAYRMAYLKAHYPVEFSASAMY